MNFQIGISAKGPLLTLNKAINSTMPKIFNNVTLNHKKSVTKWKNRQQNGLIITYHSILMLHLKKGSILNCLGKTNLLDLFVTVLKNKIQAGTTLVKTHSDKTQETIDKNKIKKCARLCKILVRYIPLNLNHFIKWLSLSKLIQKILTGVRYNSNFGTIIKNQEVSHQRKYDH